MIILLLPLSVDSDSFVLSNYIKKIQPLIPSNLIVANLSFVKYLLFSFLLLYLFIVFVMYKITVTLLVIIIELHPFFLLQRKRSNLIN